MADMKTSLDIRPFASLREATEAVLTALSTLVPLRTWMLARESDLGWVVIAAVDRTHTVKNDDVVPVSREGVVKPGDIVHFGDFDEHAPVADVHDTDEDIRMPETFTHHLAPRAYVGVPVHRSDGTVRATVCGCDPEPYPESLDSSFPTVVVAVRLLATMLSEHERRHAEERLREQLDMAAHTDILTGLANRRAWDQAIKSEQQRISLAGYPTTLFSIDVDGLKTVNDTEGHAAGDKLIGEVAAAIRTAIRPQDVVARLGGDEFGVLCADCSRTGARFVIERLRHHLKMQGLEASIGAATAVDAADLTEVWKMADAAMYEDKQRRTKAGTRKR